ncbi:MAG: GNAT family N-acetyltransferase [Thauera sp.]|jgi:predicted N-acyltransferase
MSHPEGFHLLPAIAAINPAHWDALVHATCAHPAPCLCHAYLHALEQSGSVGGHSGWTPAHATLWAGGALIAAMPLYLKAHSYGEYVFDWAWAEAYQRHGLDYYPKWLAALPFTPIPGPRLLGRDPPARRNLLTSVLAHARGSGLSSFHLLFAHDADLPLLRDAGLLVREGVQFHWTNGPQQATTAAAPPADDPELLGSAAPWHDFEAFLGSLSQDKRKKIRQERRRAAAHGLALEWLDGHSARAQDWEFFHRCYATTYALHHSTPYLSADFFQLLAHHMPDAVRLLVARRGTEALAAAFFLCDGQALYGRYWGALEELPFIHFELCYYQAIEYCLRHRLERFEGGAQGEHKLSRGLRPARTWSAHWIAEPRFAAAIDDYLARERHGINLYLDDLAARTPFRHPPAERA